MDPVLRCVTNHHQHHAPPREGWSSTVQMQTSEPGAFTVPEHAGPNPRGNSITRSIKEQHVWVQRVDMIVVFVTDNSAAADDGRRQRRRGTYFATVSAAAAAASTICFRASIHAKGGGKGLDRIIAVLCKLSCCWESKYIFHFLIT